MTRTTHLIFTAALALIANPALAQDATSTVTFTPKTQVLSVTDDRARDTRIDDRTEDTRFSTQLTAAERLGFENVTPRDTYELKPRKFGQDRMFRLKIRPELVNTNQNLFTRSFEGASDYGFGRDLTPYGR